MRDLREGNKKVQPFRPGEVSSPLFGYWLAVRGRLESFTGRKVNYRGISGNSLYPKKRNATLEEEVKI